MTSGQATITGPDPFTGTGMPGGYTARDLGRDYLAEMRRHAAWLHEEGLLFTEEEWMLKDIVARCDTALGQL